ncbi:PREDICTED: gamma-interferon-inducible lysosomal thiol reductase-like [Ceratosolen solmsi marchali]|uniref:Gamma-interferon-inducible lysosomal thiol reductase-like n=1 Tax=Ceratosolen solmsi marchali TaxID=326594 RepID=A0AAJ7E2A9_9HYME|nr:PREDICTED: gamma-interferon-inducible lysosomal thiol reductase-like [Ceratosolen solmsi marchali]
MSHPTIAFVALLVAGSIGAVKPNKTLINVEVYYESLCPDSIYFITRELAPAYPHLKDFLHLKLVPFGKASWIIDENNRTKFTCQHGPNECWGNRAQACALMEIEHLSVADPQLRQHKALDVVNCVMSSGDPALAVPQCAEKQGLPAEAIERIGKCSGSTYGDELLIANGKKTKAFETPLKFVPSIVINGEKSAAAFKNFRSIVCRLIAVSEKPAACGPSS